MAAWIVLLGITIIGTLADLQSKAWAFRTVAGSPVIVDRADVMAVVKQGGPSSVRLLIPQHPPQVVVTDLLEFTLVLNPGAVFGLGEGGRWFFISFTVLALAAATAIFAFATKAGERLHHIALGFLLAGGLGNFYDRLVHGVVRDFIHPLPGVDWPFGLSMPWSGRQIWPYVNNLADIWLIIGIVLFVILVWRAKPEPKPTERPSGSAPTDAR